MADRQSISGMNQAQVNRRILHFLQDLSDPGTFRIRGKGHIVCVASYGGEQKSFSLGVSANSNYQVYAARNVNRFIRSLSLENPPRFSLHKCFEDF